MSSYPRTVLCPVAETAAPGSGLPRVAVSLTLPGAHRSSAIARGAVTAALRAHGLTAYLWPAVFVAAELVAVTVSLTPGRDLYLSLRHRDDVLRLLVWDQHPHHPAPAAEAPCEGRRRRALWLVAAVVDDWGGEWGTCAAPPPQRGTKSWVTLPR
ncbi:ATP-binding protein [Streptomyces argenteolus]|uniref:ATP-binding protein n=1 Tax=Streptomyces sp. NPDC025273 TaxID=3155251 RepID=UPI0033D638E1